MKFAKYTLITFASQGIAIALSMVINVVVARALGPSGKGAFSLIVLIPSLLVLVASLGIWIANLYYVGNNKYKLADIASNSTILGILFGSLIAFVFLGYYFMFSPSYLRGIPSQCIILSVSTVPLGLLTMYFAYILLGLKSLGKYNLLVPVQNGSMLAILSIAVFLMNGKILGATSAWVAGNMIVFGVSFIFVITITKIHFSFNIGLFKESVCFGGKAYMGNLVSLFNNRLNMFLVAAYMDTTAVGYFSVAIYMAEAIWLLPQAVGTVVLMQTPGTELELLNKSTALICRNTVFIVTMATLFLALIGRYVIQLLFGSAFLPALKPFWILLPGIVGMSVSKVLGNEIAMRGKPMVNTYISVLTLALNVPVSLFLIPLWGISGAAFALMVSYLACGGLLIIYFTVISGNTVLQTILIRKDDLKAYQQVFMKLKNILVSEG